MRFRSRGRLLRRSCVLGLLLGAPLLLTGGCPVDQDELTTSVVQAALESISTSLLDALSTYLDTN